MSTEKFPICQGMWLTSYDKTYTNGISTIRTGANKPQQNCNFRYISRTEPREPVSKQDNFKTKNVF